jgi:nucleotide-binding universal stress UspA family protein
MTAFKNKILVPLDFSEQSIIALEQSYNLAKIANAEIVLLYVIEEPTGILKLFAKPTSEIRLFIEEKLEDLIEEKQAETGLCFEYLITKGKPYEKIIEVADMIRAKMIVMGTKAGNSISKFIGSNTLRVVQTAPCPVVTIRGKEHKKGCDTIVLPLDLTKETTHKVDKAIELANYFNADIRVISVLNTGDPEVVNKLTTQLKVIGNKIQKEGIKTVLNLIKIIEGEDTIGSAIVAYAERINADLILIMTQQESDPKFLYIGSAAREIITNSKIPVMSVLPKKIEEIKI